MCAIERRLSLRRSRALELATDAPPISKDPVAGRSTQAGMPSSEDLPEPDGPAMTVSDPINHIDMSHLPEVIRAERSNDARTLSVADALRTEGDDVTLVSKDLPLRLLAHGALGIPAEEYLNQQVTDSGYTGLVEIDVTTDDVDEFYRDGDIELGARDIPINSGVVLLGSNSSALAASLGTRQSNRSGAT
jgi:predicted ribonuclease YlaK